MTHATHERVVLTLTPWREAIQRFATEHLDHSAWGLSHACRDYAMTLQLASAEGASIDTDAVFAAAYLHDLGAFPKFSVEGVEHGARSAAEAPSILAAAEFPPEKVALVQDIIAHHMYYHAPGQSVEARLFRDADTLDFLGVIGITRILSITTRHRWAPDLMSALATIRDNMDKLPQVLQSDSARSLATTRVKEMRRFIAELSNETSSLSML